MVEGKVVQHLVTIPEGLTSEQIAARLLDSQILTGTIKDTPREGSLLPNSYAFRRGDTREQAIQRMQQAQQQVLKEAWERRSPRPAGAHARATHHPGVHHREGNRPAGGAHARRGRVRQPPQAEDAAADRSDGDLRPGARQGHARPSVVARRSRSGRRRTTPTSSMRCRRGRSPIRAARRSRPRPIRRAPRSCISSPTAPAVTPSPRPTTSTSERRAAARDRAGRRNAGAARSGELSRRRRRRRPRKPRRRTARPSGSAEEEAISRRRRGNSRLLRRDARRWSPLVTPDPRR